MAYLGGYRDVDGRWSVYWRVLDAQYFGVPQRRRRIALVADFGGCTAPEILFERSGVYGHPAQSGTAGEGTARTVENSADDASGSGIDCKTPWETQSNRVYSADGKWPALSANENGGQNRQAVYCLQGNVIDRADTANCNGRGWKEDVSYTLNTIDRPAVCAGFKLGNSENARSIGYSDEQSPTLNAECGGNKPAVVYSFDSLASNSMKSSNPHSGCREVEIAKTLDTTIPEPSKNQGGIAILDMSHANDVIRECGDTVPTLQSRMGTGGNQVPLTYAWGRSDQLTESDVACTQSARQYKSATDLICAVDCRNGTENSDVNGTLQAKSNGGFNYNSQNVVRENMAVRRLTPLECERLQGMPDYWTDIGAWRDEKGKLHKESSDAARYKAIGNSIAIPPWKWVLKRLCAQYERDATMGSLFDGLGCFPLIWTQLNGWGSVKWASEIEPFCIAVTKRHFGDEETGEHGDMWEYLTGGKKYEP